MTKKDVTLYYGIIMAIYSISYVTMSAFSSVYLLHVGLSNGGVGMLLVIGTVVAGIGTAIVFATASTKEDSVQS